MIVSKFKIEMDFTLMILSLKEYLAWLIRILECLRKSVIN